jgi:hypothetical protein
MRAARWLLGLATSFTVVAAFASGCGSSSSPAGPAGDSGSTMDVTMGDTSEMSEAAAETGTADVVDANVSDVCVPDANINTLPIPDASFGDAGATAASCVSCFKTNCPTLITNCNKNCQCVAAFEAFEACLGTGQALLTCGEMLATAPGTGITSVTQLACALGCATPSTCGYTIPTMGDGGDGGGGDGSSTPDSATATDAAGD